MSLVNIEDLNKAYKQRRILNNFNLQVNTWELVAIMGASGSGKSTLLNIIGLLEEVDSGRIYFKGKEAPSIHGQEAVKLRREFINYIFQTHALVSHLSVIDNLILAMRFVNGSNQEKRRRASQLLKHFNLDQVEEAKVASLSSGEAQRVSIIRAILKPGELILADEPTGSLDEAMAMTTFQMIQSLRDRYGKTILLVTHDSQLARKCDRVVRLAP